MDDHIDNMNAEEKRRVDDWLRKLHRQLGHAANRTMVDLLRRRGTHPVTLELARRFHCPACEEHKKPFPRNVVASYDAKPGEVLEIDGFKWRHPVTGVYCRAQLLRSSSRATRRSRATTQQKSASGHSLTDGFCIGQDQRCYVSTQMAPTSPTP